MCTEEVAVQKCAAEGCTVDDIIVYLTQVCPPAAHGECDGADTSVVGTVEGYRCGEHGGSGSLAD